MPYVSWTAKSSLSVYVSYEVGNFYNFFLLFRTDLFEILDANCFYPFGMTSTEIQK